jgi:hypothetical protein
VSLINPMVYTSRHYGKGHTKGDFNFIKKNKMIKTNCLRINLEIFILEKISNLFLKIVK